MSQRQERRWVCLVAALVAAATLSWVPQAIAAPGESGTDPAVSVRIDSLTPDTLVPGAPVTITGTVRNDNDNAWTNAQVYVSISDTAYTDRTDLTEAVEAQKGFSGGRITALDSIADLGELQAGETSAFSITVPWASLGISTTAGVHTLGVQVLGTAPDGSRSTSPIGRAATLAPVGSPTSAVPTGLVLTLASPVDLDGHGQLADLTDLIEETEPAGSLRHLIDLARSLPGGTAGLAVDAQLLDALAQATDEESPVGHDLNPVDRDHLTAFTADLTEAMSTMPTLLLDYGLPDLGAIAASDGANALREMLRSVTGQVIDDLELAGFPTASWVDAGGLDNGVVAGGTEGDRYLVSVDDLTGWSEADGSVVRLAGADTLVRRDLSGAMPGAETAATLRQQLLAEADLAARSRAEDSGSQADAVIVTAPGWDPGSVWYSADLAALWGTGRLHPGISDLTTRPPGSELESPTASAGADTTVVDAMQPLLVAVTQLDSITPDDAATNGDERLIADLLGLSWHSRTAEAIQIAADRLGEIETDLAAPSIEGPPSFLLAGRHGEVPVTIDNPTDYALEVGIRVRSSNPQLRVDDIAPVAVPAGSRTTVTIPLDVGQQNTTSLTAQLVTPDGIALGHAAQFNVRSSNTGIVVWIGMGIAAALLVVAVGRRLWRRRFPPKPKHGKPARPDESRRLAGNPTAPDASRVARASAWMALGTVVSRLTGFLRALLLIWAIGTGLNGDIFNNANTVPNALYILVAGGIFNVVLVPQLVRTMREDADGGAAYANRVITLGLLVLAAATVILVVASPLLVRLVFDSLLFTDEFSTQHTSALWLMYLCVPQVFFYGAFVLVGQVLNARERFGPMMWAPIVNNVVACGALALYMVMFGRQGGSDGFTAGECLVLGIGSTLGIAAQAAALIPYLRSAGFHYRPRFDFRGVGLGHTLRLGAWTLASIVVNQIAFIVVSRLGTRGNLQGASTGEASSGSAIYSLGYIVSQVPHGVITVSLATAIMPSLAALAHAHDYRGFLASLADTARTALFLLVPAAVALACLGHELARSISLGAAGDSSEAIGDTLVALAPAIVAFSTMFLLVRAFYADENTRVPFVLQALVAAVNVVAAVSLTGSVSPQHVAPVLGIALSLAYLTGVIGAILWIHRRFGRLIDKSMCTFIAKLTLACSVSAAGMVGMRELLQHLGLDSMDPIPALARLAVAGSLGAAAYLLTATLTGMTELRQLAAIASRR
ncbi:MAG: murein biosynthesis integral membrane protein MurJ [Aeromicrobium sp.]|uniref:murein biosynthesis integral membrane protein MurJ n=1 Tax=Aeromicrobium sp. TaxID=1871063 RepID=UPI0039E25834